MVKLSKDEKIRDLQLRALKHAKRLKYPDEYKKHIANDDALEFTKSIMEKLEPQNKPI